FAGDPHGHFEHLFAVVRASRPQALVLLGDIEAPAPLQELMAPIEAWGTQVWFIHGNHDTDRAPTWDAFPRHGGLCVALMACAAKLFNAAFQASLAHEFR
ncbi:MAG: metallophosphoesterase, partial [Gallionella sp.]